MTELIVKVANTVFRSQLIEGTFPDYTAVIPLQFNRTVILETEVIKKALNRLYAIVEDKRLNNPFILTINEKEMKVSNRISGNSYQSFTSITPKEYTGEATLEIGFNPQYLMDILKVIDSNEILISFNSNRDPAVFQVPSQSNPLFVAMPMQI